MVTNFIQRLLIKIYKSYFKKEKQKVLIKSILTSSMINVILLLGFKKIRMITPPPEINTDKLIGFSQYFGYPFYFDTIFFFFLVFIPILTFMIFYRLRRNK